MDLDNKIKKFEQSCERLAQIDAEKLNEKINTEIEEQINVELTEYVKKQEASYKKQCDKIIMLLTKINIIFIKTSFSENINFLLLLFCDLLMITASMILYIAHFLLMFLCCFLNKLYPKNNK